jgi:ERF superfamily
METTTQSVPQVYSAISAIAAYFAKNGIPKSDFNCYQKFNFRGIDALYAALAPQLAEHKLIILPRYQTRSVMEQTTKGDGLVYHVAVEGEFDLISVVDGSKLVARSFGEAMDPGDKATIKAHSAAFKTFCFQLFCIPTEGDNDADGSSWRASTGNRAGNDRYSSGNGRDSWSRHSQENRQGFQRAASTRSPQAQQQGNQQQPQPQRPSPTSSQRPPGQAPPKPQRTTMSPDEAADAERRVDEAFADRGISPDRARSIKIGLLQARKVAGVRDASPDFVARMISNIAAGMYDGQNGHRANGVARAPVV